MIAVHLLLLHHEAGSGYAVRNDLIDRLTVRKNAIRTAARS